MIECTAVIAFLQVKFHSHLNSMEESLIATRKEKAEVEALTRQLETGKTKAALELQVRQEFEYPALLRIRQLTARYCTSDMPLKKRYARY